MGVKAERREAGSEAERAERVSNQWPQRKRAERKLERERGRKQGKPCESDE